MNHRNVSRSCRLSVPVLFLLVSVGVLGNLEKGQADTKEPTAQSASSKLEFRIAPSSSVMDKAELASHMDWLKAGRIGFWWKGGRIAGRMPTCGWLPITDELVNPVIITGKYEGQTYVLVSDKPAETMLQGKGKNAWGLTKVHATTDHFARPSVGFEFDSHGAKLFAAFTKANVKKTIAIVVDGEVIAAPTLNTPMSSQASIMGRFSKQQVDVLVKALKIGMPPASPPVKRATFSPVIERVISQSDEQGKTSENCLIDFDTGKLITLPQDVFKGGFQGTIKWLEDHGVDAGASTQSAVSGLIAFDIIALPISNGVWETLTPDGLGNYNDLAFKFCKPGNPIFLTARGGTPVTYVFKTREGGIGILQILEVKTSEPKSVKIRYKMLRPGDEQKTSSAK